MCIKSAKFAFIFIQIIQICIFYPLKIVGRASESLRDETLSGQKIKLFRVVFQGLTSKT